MTVRISKTLQVVEREQWRKWLQENYLTEKEIWLVYYKKDTGKPTISYDASVEEALCFGWIDTNVQRIDDERYGRRFSPRKPGSAYARSNKERLRRLAAQGRVVPSVLLDLGE